MNVIIIQRRYRLYKINKMIKKIIKYNLFTENDFTKYKKIMMNKDLINDVNIFMKLLYNIHNIIDMKPIEFNSKIFITAIMIYNFPNEILGNDKDRHPIDILLYNNINAMISMIFKINKYHDIIKMINNIRGFEELFIEWKSMDVNRTIQNIIISYKHRQDHIKKIIMDNEQNESIINTLNDECDKMLKTILVIDNTYNIDYVKDNYDEIYNTITTTTHKIENKIKTNFQNAYIDYLVYEFSNNNDMNIIKNLIIDTNNRIVMIVPPSIKNAIDNKLKNYDYNNMLLENDWSDSFIHYFKFILDTALCCDKKNDFDIKNIKSLYQMVGNNYHYNVPYILVHINMLIDIIY
jgi:hypothetical protein